MLDIYQPGVSTRPAGTNIKTVVCAPPDPSVPSHTSPRGSPDSPRRETLPLLPQKAATVIAQRQRTYRDAKQQRPKPVLKSHHTHKLDDRCQIARQRRSLYYQSGWSNPNIVLPCGGIVMFVCALRSPSSASTNSYEHAPGFLANQARAQDRTAYVPINAPDVLKDDASAATDTGNATGSRIIIPL